MNEMRICHEDGTMVAPSNLFLECVIYRQYTPPFSSTDHQVREMVRYEPSSKVKSTLFLTCKSVLQANEVIRSNTALRGRLMQALTYCNSAAKSRATDKFFQCLVNDSSALRYRK